MKFGLESLAPAVIGLGILFDVSVRIAPYDPWSPDAFTAAARWIGVDGTVGPSRRYVVEQAYGGLARLGRRADLAAYHRDTFTTDRYGYRNSSDLKGKTRKMLFGSSFGMGLSLNDEETLTSQLEKRIHERVFNAALPGYEYGVARILNVSSLIEAQGGLAIVEYMNRYPMRKRVLLRPMTVGPLHTWIYEHGELPRELWRILKGFQGPTIHIRLSEELAMLVENGKILPNPAKDLVISRRLPSGREMLFYPPDVEFYENPRAMEDTIASFEWLRNQLSEHGLPMIVLIVPTNYTAYAPWLSGRKGLGDPGGDYLRGVEEGLRARGVPVVNSLPALRMRAAELLPDDRYVYWQNDAHWNPAGVEVVADLLAAAIHGMGGANAIQ